MNRWVSYFNRPRNLVIMLVALSLVIFIIGFVFSMNEEYTNQPEQTVSLDTKTLVDKVSNLIYLPDNEVPTIATVTDLAPLKGQSFFTDAKVGDKVLIYTKARKAVLYNPKSNKIVTIAPLSLDTESQPLKY